MRPLFIFVASSIGLGAGCSSDAMGPGRDTESVDIQLSDEVQPPFDVEPSDSAVTPDVASTDIVSTPDAVTADTTPPPDAVAVDTVDAPDTAPADTTATDTTTATNPFEPPIHVVFKIHIEPQSGLEAWHARKDTVEAVRRIAESHGAKLSIHGNGEYWQYADEQGAADHVLGWLDGGHDVGVHAHGLHQEPDGSHNWSNLPTTADAAAIREAWDDHHRALARLLPEHVIDQATPWNSADADFVAQMDDFGYSVLGGGRHEIATAWFGHHPFFPFRIGARFLEEDLTSPVLMVHHSAQIGEAKEHGPPGGRTFQDQTVPHLKTQFLQVYLNRLHAERHGDPDDRIWLFGFLTHDNQSPLATQNAIDGFMDWIDTHFANGRVSLRGNPIARYASMGEVAAAYRTWEMAHPGVSSHHVPTPTPLDPSDATRISPETSRAAYIGPYWGMAQLLKANANMVVDHIAVRTDFAGLGVACHELAFGPRQNAAIRDARFVLFKESDGAVDVDVSALVGAGQPTRVWDAVDRSYRVVLDGRVRVAEHPVLLEKASVPLAP